MVRKNAEMVLGGNQICWNYCGISVDRENADMVLGEFRLILAPVRRVALENVFLAQRVANNLMTVHIAKTRSFNALIRFHKAEWLCLPENLRRSI